VTPVPELVPVPVTQATVDHVARVVHDPAVHQPHWNTTESTPCITSTADYEDGTTTRTNFQPAIKTHAKEQVQ